MIQRIILLGACGLVQLVLTGPAAQTYVTETFSFTARGTSTTLTFASEDASSSSWGSMIDDVSVHAVSGVPEPTSWLLVSTASATLLLGCWRAARRG